MENESDQLLEDIRKSFVERRKRLKILQDDFKRLGESEQEEFKKMSHQVMSNYAYFMNDIYTRMEEMFISNFALKDQFEMLKDIVIQLPEIKNNQQIQKVIEKMFKKYDKSY